MKSFFSGFLKFHLLPIIASLLVLFLLDSILYKFYRVDSDDSIVISGKATSIRGSFSNCEQEQAEIELIASLQSNNKLTIMGSSELQGLPYSSNYFLPDSIGIPTTAFGHAYHQNLSIACELLAAGDKLDGANVCIILSPGWFETKGTNIEAFLEFVRPNFLRSIIHNQSISKEHKLRIARYVYNEYHNINNPSVELAYLRNLYINEKSQGWPKSISKIYSAPIKQVNYIIENQYNYSNLKYNSQLDFDKTKKRLQAEFLKTCTNNSIFVDSLYYSKYLMATGEYKKTRMNAITLGEEYQDFLMVVNILKQHNCKATFILQPLNPYNYDDLTQLNELRFKMKEKLKECGFPILDMYVTDPSDYTPGILKDIMHPSDRGWMEMNEFLIKQYKK